MGNDEDMQRQEGYLLFRDGRYAGPYSRAELNDLIERGQAEPDQLAQIEGTPIWRPIRILLCDERNQSGSVPGWKSIYRSIVLRLRAEFVSPSPQLALIPLVIGTIALLLQRVPFLFWLPWFAIALTCSAGLFCSGRRLSGAAMGVAVFALPFWLLPRDNHKGGSSNVPNAVTVHVPSQSQQTASDVKMPSPKVIPASPIEPPRIVASLTPESKPTPVPTPRPAQPQEPLQGEAVLSSATQDSTLKRVDSESAKSQPVALRTAFEAGPSLPVSPLPSPVPVFAKGSSLTIDAHEAGTGSGTARTWVTEWGSYDKSKFRTKGLEVEVRNLSRAMTGDCKLTVYWVGRGLKKNDRLITHAETFDMNLGSAQKTKFVSWCPILDARKQNYALLGQTYVSGSKFDGWFVLLTRDGEILGAKGADAGYTSFISRDENLQPLLATWKGSTEHATATMPSWRKERPDFHANPKPVSTTPDYVSPQ